MGIVAEAKAQGRRGIIMVLEFLCAAQGRLNYSDEPGKKEYAMKMITYGSGKAEAS